MLRLCLSDLLSRELPIQSSSEDSVSTLFRSYRVTGAGVMTLNVRSVYHPSMSFSFEGPLRTKTSCSCIILDYLHFSKLNQSYIENGKKEKRSQR